MDWMLRSLKRLVAQWTLTRSPLIQDAKKGDTILKVLTSQRLLPGDEIYIKNNQGDAELSFFIVERFDACTIKIEPALEFDWNVADNAIVEKIFASQRLQHIYVGDPAAIPMYPAVIIKPSSRSSEWFTIESTKERYSVDIQVVTKGGVQEQTYIALMRIAQTIERGLKNNIYPFIGPFTQLNLIEDISPGDTILKVDDTSKITGKLLRAFIEDYFYAQEVFLGQIIDKNTIVSKQPICREVLVDNGGVVLGTKRFIYNSWPENIEYTNIFKGTMLKAANITWFAEEEILEDTNPAIEPHLPNVPDDYYANQKRNVFD